MTKKKKFKEEWRANFQWISHDEEQSILGCIVCKEAGKKNVFAKFEYGKNGMKKDDMTKHSCSRDHLAALQTTNFPGLIEAQKRSFYDRNTQSRKRTQHVVQSEIRQVELIKSFSKEVIRLNVGGKLYFTSKQTIQKYPGSLLSAMVSAESNYTPNEEGVYFIDRDGDAFRYILNFLRDGITSEVWVKPNEKALVVGEAEFYGLIDYMFPYWQGENLALNYIANGTRKANIHDIEKGLEFSELVAVSLKVLRINDQDTTTFIKSIDGIYCLKEINDKEDSGTWHHIKGLHDFFDQQGKKPSKYRKKQKTKLTIDLTYQKSTGILHLNQQELLLSDKSFKKKVAAPAPVAVPADPAPLAANMSTSGFVGENSVTDLPLPEPMVPQKVFQILGPEPMEEPRNAFLTSLPNNPNDRLVGIRNWELTLDSGESKLIQIQIDHAHFLDFHDTMAARKLVSILKH